jgi:hypothetical protein
MIASAIGKTFLDAYNAREKTRYTAEEFFEKIFFPLFYDDEKIMQWVHGSPFFQLASVEKKQHIPERRREVFNYFKSEISKGKPHGGLAIGYPAGNKYDSKGTYVVEYSTTSSQLSSLDLPLDTETLYLSWIGGGLGIGVQGGLCIFLNHADILLKLFEGWSFYRNSFLNKITKLKGSQIETWNGQWLAHRLSDEFIEEYPISGLNTLDKAGERLETQSWLRVLSGVALNYAADSLTGYVYSYGQTNRSIGFIPFVLPQIKRPLTLFRKLFGSQIKLEAVKIEDLFGTEYGFLKACEMGVIGLKAMEPKGVRAYIGTTENEAKIPKYPKNTDSQPLTFSIYITWVIAMLNNEELWNQAETYAQALINYESGAGKGRMDRVNDVKSFLTSSFQKPILASLSSIAEKAESKESFLELGKTIHFLPKDNVPYFMTLIRFRYAFLKK